ncbi:MAG: DNA polymerase IV [Planctomycetes bacterium]|nr:DNA polymerase IV [Planctomycetota bacterium]
MPPANRDLLLPPGTRRILHLDVDAFLASVECALHPELAGRPLVIGGLPHERNLVMSSSYEARVYGVRPGLLLAEAKRLCPHAIFRRGDAQAAARLRDELTRVVMRYTPRVEVTSIDDLLADVTGTARLFGPAFELAVALRAAVRAEVNLPVTIGIGTSVTLARLAGKLAKPGGVAEVWPGHEEAFLAGLPIEHLPGVGFSTGRLLARFSIRTVGDLRRVSREVLFASFGKLGLVLHDRARGVDPERIEPTWIPGPDGRLVRRAPRSIRRDSTFEPEEGSRRRVEAMLAYLVDRAMHKLRGLGLTVSTLEVHVRYVDTRPPSLRRAQRLAAPAEREAAAAETATRRVRRTLDAPTDSTDRVAAEARALLRSLPRRRALVKRVGVELANLRPASGWQGTLFSEPGGDRIAEDARGPSGSHADRQRRLDDAVDALRARVGFGRVLRGSSLALGETHELEVGGYRLRTPSLNQ